MIHDPQRNDETASGQGERVAKALARAGVASRRDVEKLIEAGRVALNGAVLTTPAVKVEPGDILTVDGEVVEQAEPTRLFRYHKPVDLLTTHKDPKGRATVFDALPPGLPRLISVGRLDINSEGLLLLTNDGELARALEQPTTGLVRRYRVRARGRITQPELDKLKDGVTVEGVQYGPIDAKIDKAKDGPQGANIWLTVVLAEGKNREVRRVLKSLGLLVGRLIRLSYGPFSLGTLEMGHIEEVGPRVIREQLADYIDAEFMPTGDRPLFAGKAGPSGRRGVSAPSDGVPKPKAVYKTGWATPKIEVKVHSGKPRRAPRPGQDDSQVPVAPRMRSSRLAEDKPGGIRTFTPGQAPAVTRDRPPRAAGKPVYGRAKSFDGKRDDGRSGNARGPKLSSGPPRSGGPRSSSPRSASGEQSGYVRSGPPRDGPARSGPPRSGPPRSGPPRSAAAGESSSYVRSGPPRSGASDGAPRSGPPRSGPPRDGAARSGPPRDGPARSGPSKSGPPRSGPPRSASGEQSGYVRSGPPRSGSSDGAPRSGPPRSGPPRDGATRSGPPRSGPPRSASSDGAPRSGLPRSGPPRDGAARSGPPRSGPPRSGPPKDGASRSGPPRSGPPRSGPPKSGAPRSGPPRSGPPKSGPRGPKRD
ncbi:MAG: pseudouridine synthase [Pseudomonadota bacterium]|uniref:pseudouridine synthase n=1 Tax=Phenylobacterium sp. TaxID=1871053 RepID=UPI0027F732F4|nr:pseudouridine synthase [Phenylobacterium sp.]